MASRRSARTASRVIDVSKEPTLANGLVKETLSKPVLKAVKKRTASDAVPIDESSFKVPEIPQTPPPKRQRKPTNTVLDSPPPATPTPSTVQIIAHTSSNPRRTPAKTRKVAPHVTNAPLQTPLGTRIVKYSSDLFETGQSSQNGGEERVTTENLLEKACHHLCTVDARLKPVIEKHRCKMFSPEGLAEEVEPFEALSSGIISQQVSGAAATSIKRKFVELFHPPLSENDQHTSAPAQIAEQEVSTLSIPPPNERRFPTPAQVVEKDIPTLRTAGLSQRKAEYIHGLAEKFYNGELSASMLIEATDEEVLEKLIAVRGLGRWSVEMFACFGLKRTDIFSTGDLGVQRGMAAFVGRDVAKLKNKGGKWKYMSEKEMLEIAEPFAPYRSLFMWYMWRVEDVKTEAME